MFKRMMCASALAIAATNVALGQTPCERLRKLSLPNTRITAARDVKARTPAYCRVAATLTPSSDSLIDVELWLPVRASWNGKYLAVGGGGWAGDLNMAEMSYPLEQGYATSSTDTGHKGANAAFAPGHPEKLIDFAYRAVHEMTVTSKAIMKSYYGRGPRLSYWKGCSTGGRQGLMEAVRYPKDYDGIIAGAPANQQIRLGAWRMNWDLAIRKDPRGMLPRSKRELVHRNVLAACDDLDGVKDGLLSDPLKCRFDPSGLLCRNGEAENCLTAAQVGILKMAYAPATKLNGELIYPGLVPGGEVTWNVRAFDGAPSPGPIDLDIFRYLAHEDPAWDFNTFDLERDTALALSKAGYIEVTDPDLAAFKAHGGKLLMYHGWNDGGTSGEISPLNSVNYYNSILARMGPQQGDWLRLFMVPGMGHCGLGSGPNRFDAVRTMERWREQGKAPGQMTGYGRTADNTDFSRPLCPYPQIPVYKGTGSTNEAVNFTCKAP